VWHYDLYDADCGENYRGGGGIMMNMTRMDYGARAMMNSMWDF
jgi:hypothetical protein